MTLRQLAADILDKKVKGNEDQLVANVVAERWNHLPGDMLNRKIESAIRGFPATKQAVRRERHIRERIDR